MEQHKSAAKPISKILKLLPGATSSVSFQNPTLIYSPVKDKRSSEKPHKSNLGIGFSGPVVSMIQSDNRRKIKNNSTSTFSYEPTSPTVSCMGTVKGKQHRKKISGATNKPPPRVSKPTNKFSRTASFSPVRANKREDDPVVVDECKKKSLIRSLLRGGASRSGRKSDATNNKSTTALDLQKAPCLSTMKRFSSGRDAFTNFDWTTQVTPLDSGHPNYFTDDERNCGSDGEGDDDVMVPSSVPVMVRNKGVCDNFIRDFGGVNLEPKKEINLWKRRTMVQPQPLQLHAA